MRSRALIASTAALATVILLATAASIASAGSLPALAPAPADSLTRALESGRIGEAEYALERARSLFTRSGVAARYGALARPGPRDATLVLRDLALRARSLAGAERDEALRILARPDDGPSDPFGDGYAVPSRFDCGPHVCVHWVETTLDAPPRADVDLDGIPDHVELVQAVTEEVFGAVVERLGYRPPKQDGTSPSPGPDGLLDVYLVDVGANGLYGYCTTDDPALLTQARTGDVSAYCVLDDDFSPFQFPGDPRDSLRVTAAHELFHAVQFGYDVYEDAWFMESSAVWMEDEVYDDVNDNYQYLDTSILKRPGIPLDLGLRSYSDPLAGFQYGAFVFWRYLAERYGDPALVRRAWELADDAPGAPDLYSLRAAEAMLAERGAALGRVFADFVTANVSPRMFYEEGAAYPSASRTRSRLVTAGSRPLARTVRLDHLTAEYVSFRPGLRTPARARLRIDLDLPPATRGAQASLLVFGQGGEPRARRIALDSAGDARVTLGFRRAEIAEVVLVLANGSARLRCWRGSDFSCKGEPLDDRLAFRYEAKILGRPATAAR